MFYENRSSMKDKGGEGDSLPFDVFGLGAFLSFSSFRFRDLPPSRCEGIILCRMS